MVTETKVYLVKVHKVERMSVESVWCTESEAMAEAERLAREDARETGEIVPSRQVRIEHEANVWRVQKRVSGDADPWTSAKSIEWHTLRHYSVQSFLVQGNVVHRLAELAP